MLFVHKLKDIYSAEDQILQALPKMIEEASSEELATAFSEHLEQTKGQVERLDKISELIDQSLTGVRCKGMEGIIKEGEEVMKKDFSSEVKDAGMLAAAQVVEHYEIANYGTLVEWATVMGHDEVADLLQETLDEEMETDEKLTSLAESSINDEAFDMGEEESDDTE